MKIKNKKICLLVAGGTVLSEKDLSAVETGSDLGNWLLKMPELSIMADVEPVFICGEKSPFKGIELWQKIAGEIYSRLNQSAGFIVTSSVNDVLYNALAASFAIENINKPIIFTGSQLPIINKELIEKKRKVFGGLGIKANLINAVQIATMDIPAVGIMFGNRCIRAVRAQRSAIYSLNVFTSVDDSYLAKIDFGVSPAEKNQPSAQKPILKDKFEQNVFLIKYFSGMSFDTLKSLLETSRGLVIEGSPIEGFAKEFLNGLKKLKIPVVVYNNFFVQKLRAENIIEISNMTLETTLIKFMWALGQSGNVFEIRELMYEQFCNEFIKHK